MTILFSGLISTLVSLVITIFVNTLFQRHNTKLKLDDTLMQLNKNVLDNPFLENDESLIRYKKMNKTEESILEDKYNIFCIMKYNYLEDYCKFYNFNLKKIRKRIHIREYLKDNDKWWASNRKINYESYDKNFIHLIEEVLNEA